MDPSRPMNEWQIHNVQDSVITTIQNLVTSETYTIQVLAFTSVGDGPFSDPVHVKVMPGGQWVCDRSYVRRHNHQSSTFHLFVCRRVWVFRCERVQMTHYLFVRGKKKPLKQLI